MAKKDRIYWDSSVFIAYLKDEVIEGDPRGAITASLMDRARAGKVEIATSTITIAEVYRGQGQQPLNDDERDYLHNLFREPYIVPVDVTRRVAEEARGINQQIGCKVADGIHIASALAANATVMHAYDRPHMLNHSQRFGDPPLAISKPNWPDDQGQLSLGLMSAGMRLV